MAERTLYQFKVWCNTEALYHTAWAEKAPTVCPYIAAHPIDANKTTILDKSIDGAIEAKIREENIKAKTGGHFLAYSIEIDVPLNGDPDPKDTTFPFPISLMAMQFTAPANALKDVIEVQLHPDEIAGKLTAAAAIGDKVFKVDQGVLDAVHIGHWLKIGADDLGRVTRVDKTLNEVDTENALTVAASVDDDVLHTSKFIPRLEIASTNTYYIGGSKIGGAYIPKGKIIRIVYKNVETTAKRFSVVPELLY